MFVCVNHKNRVADYKMSVNDVVTVGLCGECEDELSYSRESILVVVTPTNVSN